MTELMLDRTRVAEDLNLTCPAAAPIGERLEGAGCLCRVTGTVISSATDPSSLAAFCTGRYTGCPAWRDDRERDWEARKSLKADSAKQDSVRRDRVKRRRERADAYLEATNGEGASTAGRLGMVPNFLRESDG